MSPPHTNWPLIILSEFKNNPHLLPYGPTSPPPAIREVDSMVEAISRNMWNLPVSFPNAGLRVLLEDLELAIPSNIRSDNQISTPISSRIHIHLDRDGYPLETQSFSQATLLLHKLASV